MSNDLENDCTSSTSSSSSIESAPLPSPIIPTTDCSDLPSSNYLQLVQEIRRLRVELATVKNHLVLANRQNMDLQIELFTTTEKTERTAFLENRNLELLWKIETLLNEISVLKLTNTLWNARFVNMSSRFNSLSDAFKEYSDWFSTENFFTNE